MTYSGVYENLSADAPAISVNNGEEREASLRRKIAELDKRIALVKTKLKEFDYILNLSKEVRGTMENYVLFYESPGTPRNQTLEIGIESQPLREVAIAASTAAPESDEKAGWNEYHNSMKEEEKNHNMSLPRLKLISFLWMQVRSVARGRQHIFTNLFLHALKGGMITQTGHIMSYLPKGVTSPFDFSWERMAKSSWAER
ncbi:hypothetical protein RND71_007993 [Anisodus tanguticus]|uniref:Uncharacterized protein n=1 Tax=Anisodus tanguticus TaxID=243964 RepID=A0AAE1VTG9_9SOLA|nr:hypothetical protein RND71_007993 [Anisodus tanguticus]